MEVEVNREWDKYEVVLAKVDNVRQTSFFSDKIRVFFKNCSIVDLINPCLSKIFETVFMEIFI